MTDIPDTIEIDGVQYVRAWPVAGDRCPCCGAGPRAWTPGQIVGAIRAHVARRGQVPSRYQWSKATADHPEFQVALRTFGTWGDAVRAAGFEPLGQGGSLYWTRSRILVAFSTWYERYGRPPTSREWEKATAEHPAAVTVRRRFGTWNKGMDAAGFFPRGPYGARLRERGAGRREARAMVDAAPVAEAVRDYLGPHGSAKLLAETIGIDPTPIHKLLSGRRSVVELSSADRILQAIDRPDVLAGLEAA